MIKNLLSSLLVLFVLAVSHSDAAELRPETLRAWNDYIHAVELNMQHRAAEPRHFLWVDEQAERTTAVRGGDPQVGPANGHGTHSVPNGLIHDWVGATFIPGATIEQVRAILRDYNNYKRIYNPQVINSQTMALSEAGDEFSMTWVDKVLMISSGIDTECRVSNVSVSDKRYYRTTNTTRVQQIQNYGQPNQRALPPDQGDGFLWRLYSIARMEQRDSGVYLEFEAIALSRDIPGSLRFVVTPIVKRLARNSLLVSLRKTQDAIEYSADAGSSLAAVQHSGPSAHPTDAKVSGLSFVSRH